MLLLLFLLSLPPAVLSSVPSGCVERRFPQLGPNHFVCVCNATYCDEYQDLPSSPNSASVYSSSEARDRMAARSVPIAKLRRTKPGVARIKVDARVTYQEIIGFGGAFTDAAGINIMSLSGETRERLLQSLFGTNGARYSIGRVPIASTDFSTRIYSYNDNAGDESMAKFALAEEDEKFKIPLIKRALSLTRGALRLFSSPWSAPFWMKESGKMEGPGKLSKGLHAAWAQYFVKFFDAYSSHGISFWSTTVQNEPTSGVLPTYGWQTMYWNSTGERSFVASHLGPALASSHSAENVKIISLDDNRFWLPQWANEVFSDPLSSSFISGIGIHWYMDFFTSPSSLTATHKAHPDKFILATEGCSGYSFPHHGPSLGEWSRAERYATSIVEDLNNFVAGWTDWNLALDAQGGPTWARNFVDASLIVNGTADEFLKQPIHYALTHFSRFFRPGSKRIESSGFGLDKSRVLHTAVMLNGQRVLNILNTRTSAQEVVVEDASGGSITLTIDPKSLTTVVWNKP